MSQPPPPPSTPPSGSDPQIPAPPPPAPPPGYFAEGTAPSPPGGAPSTSYGPPARWRSLRGITPAHGQRLRRRLLLQHRRRNLAELARAVE